MEVTIDQTAAVSGTLASSALSPERVIFASSFSKTVCPGVRVGYLVGSPELIAKIVRRATNTYIAPDMLAQSVVYEFARSESIGKAVANVQVALLVLGPTRRLRPAFIAVPLDSTHDIALTALIGIVSLSPGTLCAELSDDHAQLLIHVLDLDDEAALVAQIKTRYEAPLMEIFAC